MAPILVTGGAGFIGSHTVLELLQAGYEVVVVDNLSNSSEESLKRVQELTGKTLTFVKADLLDRQALTDIFEKYKPQAVIHFAGLKAVGDSVRVPLDYYHNNITGTVTLLEVMSKAQCKNIVFSSSATVYGIPESLPLIETARTGATNPYGRTKLFIEEILKDLHVSDPTWRIIVLRYFNPVGAHVSGRIGEDPKGIPNNLMPFVSQVAVGKRPHVSVFGNDYPTPDGTGVRDYIHVVDLSVGHLAALRRIEREGSTGAWEAFNLGTGNGYSVLEMIAAMEKASGNKIEHKVAPRRDGDVASMWADCSKAEKELGWKASRNLEVMCADLWRWQSANPNGFM